MRCEGTQFRSLLISAGSFLFLAFLISGCQKAPGPEAEPVSPDTSEEQESEQTEPEETTEFADPKEDYEEPTFPSIYGGNIVRQVTVAPDTSSETLLRGCIN